MDLTISLGEEYLNVRVAAILKTKDGYVFENDSRCVFILGGRCRIRESSKDAIIREVKEEVGFDIGGDNLKLVGMVENFYENNSAKQKVHEICFVYLINKEFDGVLSGKLVSISVDEMDNFDIRPKQIVNIIRNLNVFNHLIIRNY